MSPINRLIANYQRFVQLPWAARPAPSERVWFAVYHPAEERRLRARLREFEVATQEAKHAWRLVDITRLPAAWLWGLRDREAYLADPEALLGLQEDLEAAVAACVIAACTVDETDADTVVAVLGAGSLFGFTHVSPIIKQVEDAIQGRLLVFFPGEYEHSQYRFMDARHGFNYMAVPITCSERSLG